MVTDKKNIKTFLKRTFEIEEGLFYLFKLKVVESRATQRDLINKVLREYLGK